MKINHNDSAVITNVKLLRNETFLTESMERLSTGFRINHASDNPSGMAISNKMQAQINALNQASRNSSDGMSVLETADGTMQELTNILQRVRELAVQAANDANADDDRDKIQVEIDELINEVNRISEASEFNTKSLLDGSLDTRSYGDHMSRRHISDGVQEGFYRMTVETAATQTKATIKEFDVNSYGFPNPITEDEEKVVRINDQDIAITKGMTEDEFKAAIKSGCERAGIVADPTNGEVYTEEFGRSSSIYATIGGNSIIDPANYEQGIDAVIKPDFTSAFLGHENANIIQYDNKISIVDANDFEISFKLEDGYDGDLELEVTDLGPMDIQVGANAHQQIPVRIPSVSVEDLYLDKVNVKTHIQASKAIAACDNAISYVNRARAKVGAATNRLEHSVLSTDNSEENMTAAVSRIKDVDMAEEMTEYTKQNVLVQAATSALSQANEIPQMALQLLR